MNQINTILKIKYKLTEIFEFIEANLDGNCKLNCNEIQDPVPNNSLNRPIEICNVKNIDNSKNGIKIENKSLRKSIINIDFNKKLPQVSKGRNGYQFFSINKENLNVQIVLGQSLGIDNIQKVINKYFQQINLDTYEMNMIIQKFKNHYKLSDEDIDNLRNNLFNYERKQNEDILQTINDKYQFKHFLIESGYFQQESQCELNQLSEFKKGTKKILRQSEVPEFDLPLSKQVKDTHARQLSEIVRSNPTLSMQINENSTTKIIPRNQLIRLINKFIPEQMQEVKNRVNEIKIKQKQNNRIQCKKMTPFKRNKPWLEKVNQCLIQNNYKNMFDNNFSHTLNFQNLFLDQDITNNEKTLDNLENNSNQSNIIDKSIFKMFLDTNGQFYQESQCELNQLSEFKKGTKKILLLSEVPEFDLHQSKQVKDSQALQLSEIVKSNPTLSMQINEKSTSFIPRNQLIRLINKFIPEQMQEVKNRVHEVGLTLRNKKQIIEKRLNKLSRNKPWKENQLKIYEENEFNCMSQNCNSIEQKIDNQEYDLKDLNIENNQSIKDDSKNDFTITNIGINEKINEIFNQAMKTKMIINDYKSIEYDLLKK